MNYPELIWRLVEMLLQKYEDNNQSIVDDASVSKSNSQEQDEA